MESNLIKDLTAERDGEHLSGALAEAERKAREFRQKATALVAEAEKWERISSELRQVLDLARRPAGEVKRGADASVEKPASERRPMRRHGFWPTAIATALRGWNATHTLGRGPTKRELAAELVSSAQVTEREAMFAINYAVTLGRLDYRVDHLYLPKTALASALAAAD